MATARRSVATKSVRQSITLPTTLHAEIRRHAQKRNVSFSHALTDLATRGLRAEAKANEHLRSAFEEFLAKSGTVGEEPAGRELIRAVFGNGAIPANPGF
jgi:predicted DNA-binding ribbon-helix-helix protein